MISSIFGSLGAWVAPRMSSVPELICLIKSGQEPQAIAFLHSTNASEWISRNASDSTDGLALIDSANLEGFNALQMACMHGNLPIVMELLSFGARLDLPCTSLHETYSGNLPLHFAALSNNKYIMEYLMLRGADPSVPNKKGSIAWDLTSDKFCQEILQRDKKEVIMTMLSPMDKSRMSMMNCGSGKDEDEDSSSMERLVSSMNINESSGFPVEFLQADSPGKHVGSTFVPALDLSNVKLTIDDNNSSRFNSPNAIGVITTTSSGRDSMTSTPNRSQVSKNNLKKDCSGSKVSNDNTPNASMRSSRQRSISSYEPYVYHPSTARSTRSNSTMIPFQQSLEKSLSKTPPPPPIFSPNISFSGESTSGIQDTFREENFHSAGLNFHENTNIDPDKEEMENFVLQAALETSSAFIDRDVNETVCNKIFKACATAQTKFSCQPDEIERKEKQLRLIRGYLDKQPQLVMCRCIGNQESARDGQTPLHVAATWNNVSLMKVFLAVPNVSVWVRDLQGRTPLHCAVDTEKLKSSHVLNKDTTEMCRLLKEYMQKERMQNPVGRHAPLDITGRTPLGRYDGQRIEKGTVPSKEMIDLLYEDGDRSVLPKSPCHQRSGSSPMKPSLRASSVNSTENGNICRSGSRIVYAFSEASGWKPYMEDRVIAHCPLSSEMYSQGHSREIPAEYSLFGVCDGHNGTFCAQYIKDHLAEYVLSEISSGKNLSETEIMYQACHEMEHQLENHEYMAVDVVPNKDGQEYNEKTGQPLKTESVDSSGTTGVFCLISVDNIAIANVGDSKAIIAKFTEDPFQVNQKAPISSPFQKMGNENEKKIKIVPSFVTVDHTLCLEKEKTRVLEAGGVIKMADGSVLSSDSPESASRAMEKGRICIEEANADSVNFTRSFGDFSFKKNFRKKKNEQIVIAEADVTVIPKDKKDAFIVLACDGITNVMSDEEIVSFLAKELGFVQVLVKQEFDEDGNAKEVIVEGNACLPPEGKIDEGGIAMACDRLLKNCLEKKSSDNMSVLVVVM